MEKATAGWLSEERKAASIAAGGKTTFSFKKVD